MNWKAWLKVNWGKLASGSEIDVPRWMPHPSHSGFHKIEIADYAGQVANWGISLADGSRIHIHEFADGSLRAHRDQFDPARGTESTVQHVMRETPWGTLALIVAGVCLVAAVADA